LRIALTARGLWVGQKSYRRLQCRQFQCSTVHIHAEYGEYECSIAIADGSVLAGSFPQSKMKLVQAWIEIHREDLLADWKLAVAGEPIFKIDPLK